ncbi:transglutaminase-like cysteine peptidase [Chitinimonas naiadis]
MTLAFGLPNFDILFKSFSQRWGATPAPRFQAWRDLMRDGAGGSELERLKTVNDFFNRQIAFGDDPAIWGQVDYWATPLETLGRGAGDCEDFVIAKYFTLSYLGVPIDKLRLTYVKAKIGGASSSISQAHMVLTYYAQADAEPLVLDNLIGDIRPASRRPDLTPVFSFNSNGVWVGGGKQASSPVERLSRWTELLARMHSEGFEQ